ncbi:MAG TPA: hypothetical protein VJ965_12380 [Anaerolineales bacterium]|nr:hypothetical protein [Anaerolineales bacterium]
MADKILVTFDKGVDKNICSVVKYESNVSILSKKLNTGIAGSLPPSIGSEFFIFYAGRFFFEVEK